MMEFGIDMFSPGTKLVNSYHFNHTAVILKSATMDFGIGFGDGKPITHNPFSLLLSPSCELLPVVHRIILYIHFQLRSMLLLDGTHKSAVITQLLTKHKRLTQQSTYWLTGRNAQISPALP